MTVFRDDLGQSATVEELEALSRTKRRAKLDAIRDACRDYVTGPMRNAVAQLASDVTDGAARVEVDADDPDGQTLLLWYPEVEPRDGAYVRPAVRIESGAKSALDPHGVVTIKPYVADEATGLDLAVPGVTAIEPGRTLWDKIVIAHGLRRWYERRGVLRQEGQRVSRHYYDLHRLVQSEAGRIALGDAGLGQDCVRHARTFFDRPDYDLATAQSCTFAILPSDGMIDALRRDYDNTTGMIFGEPPPFEAVVASARAVEAFINGAPPSASTASPT